MRVFVAGATGVIGRPLTRQLVEAGHEVVGTTRSAERTEIVRALGAEAVVVDALDTDGLRRAVVDARPEAVVNQLTSYPARFNYRKAEQTFGPTTELRGSVGPALAGIAAEAGARRIVSQSVCFYYAATGSGLHTEDDPLMDPPNPVLRRAVVALEALESATLETPGLEGVVLRYGFFYGPETPYSEGGSYWTDVRRRRFPVVGAGTGVFSFVHVEDAAAATVAALHRGSGTYNVCDDEPAPMAGWLPVYAEAIGAKPPLRAPVWLARLVAGRQVAVMATRLEGASNERAKRELGWQPRYPSWRQGFFEALS